MWEMNMLKDEGNKIRTYLNLIKLIASNDELHPRIPLLQNLNPLCNLRFTPKLIHQLTFPSRIEEEKEKTRPTSKYAASMPIGNTPTSTNRWSGPSGCRWS
jgi:hypothetical protein